MLRILTMLCTEGGRLKDDIRRQKLSNFERIASYLQEEGCPRTPQEISMWTDIPLGDVYRVLQENTVFFKEIIKGDELKGWIVATPMW